MVKRDLKWSFCARPKRHVNGLVPEAPYNVYLLKGDDLQSWIGLSSMSTFIAPKYTSLTGDIAKIIPLL